MCSTCTTRGIPCYGYGPKPQWMDGAGLEAEHIKKIKRAAENNYRARRRGLIPDFAGTYTEITERKAFCGSIKEWEDPDAGHLLSWNDGRFTEYPGVPGHFSSSSSPDPTWSSLRQTLTESDNFNLISTSDGKRLKVPYSAENKSQAISTWQYSCPCTMDSIWWHSDLANTYSIRNKKELDLLMHYLDNVFSLQFGFVRSSASGTDSAWYANTLLRSKPLYHATLSISAFHQSLLRRASPKNPKNTS